MKSILCVDDNDINLFILEDLLKEEGYAVQAFERAKPALEWLEEHKEECDLILTDIHMPEMNGIEFMQLCKKMMITCPLVGMSGDEEQDILQEAFDAGMSTFVSKPYKAAELLQNIEKWIK